MYKAITSLWSKSTSVHRTQLSSNSQVDDDSWVLVSNGETPTVKNNNLMTNSWIASPPLIKTDEVQVNVQHLNPIENLLIEHPSMSVYAQIASKTRNRRQKKVLNDNRLDEQVEEVEEEDDDDDDRASMSHQCPSLTSSHHQNMNLSSNSSSSTLETSASSLVAHHRRLHRLHHRRKRSNKLNITSNIDEAKRVLNKNIERQRLNHTRPPKILQQSSRSNH